MSIKQHIKFVRPQFHLGIERWKYYMPLDIYVSSFGRIKNAAGELQKVGVKDNYLVYKGKLVHRIVIQAFNPIPNYANLTVDHLDHNTRNNRLSNLEWVTDEENKARDRADRAINAPAITSETVIKTTAPSGEKMFLVNKVAMTFEAAKAMLKNDKTLSGTANIERAFERAMSKKEEMKFGNYTIQYVRT